MNREDTVKLFLECEAKRKEALAAGQDENKAHEAARRHWNTWAQKAISERLDLEKKGLWENTARADFSGFSFPAAELDSKAVEDRDDMVESPHNEAARIDGAVIDMRGFIFPGDADFSEAIFAIRTQYDKAWFSSDASFREAKFEGYTSFSGARFSSKADFIGATFTSEANFNNATFKDALFHNVTFFREARFFGATLNENSIFTRTKFQGDAHFHNATFAGETSFGSACFSEYAFFASAKFLDDALFRNTSFNYALFDRASFSGNASFGSATFTKSTSFRGTEFGSEEKKTDANFTGIKVERAFDLTSACFSKVPNFSQADFKQAPDLDSVRFPLPRAEPLLSGEPSLIPQYRMLRRMAIQSADYDREQRAFKGETRSRRWKIDKFWHPEGFFGWCYDWAADCGRSILRPFAIWLLSVFVFAVLYLPAGKNALDGCVSDDGSMFWNSLYISGRNALVVSTAGKSESAVKAYQCLFSSNSAPLGVSSVETFVQAPLSAVLIFLFLLAVKNRFKIK